MSDKITKSVISSIAVLAFGIAATSNFVRAAGGLSTLKMPYVIAHRGGRLLWPEHTMEAYNFSVEAGSKFVETDCYLLKDNSIIIMHDETLDRTTTGRGSVVAQSGRTIKNILVDGKKLLGPPWTQYHIPYFDEVLARFGNREVVFVEAKNNAVGSALVSKLCEYRINPDYTVVNSFDRRPLILARAAGYKTCLDLRANDEPPVSQLVKSKYWAVGCAIPVSEAYVHALKRAGFVVLAYTPANHAERDEALAKGVDGYYCDDPIYMAPDITYVRNTDPFDRQTWYAGMLAAQTGGRGRFSSPDKWGIDTSVDDVFRGCLQGWLMPLKNGGLAPNWTIELTVTFGVSTMNGRWASIGVFTDDRPIETDTRTRGHHGFNFLFCNNGTLAVYKYDGTSTPDPKRVGLLVRNDHFSGTSHHYRVTVSPAGFKAECVDCGTTLTVDDPTNRGGCITFGAKGQSVEFSQVRLQTQ